MITDLISFFPSEYSKRKHGQGGRRAYPYIVVHFLNQGDIYFHPVGNYYNAGERKEGLVNMSRAIIDIYTKDVLKTNFYTSGFTSGNKEGYTQADNLKKHISKNWNSILDNGEIKQPIRFEDLTGILTTQVEHRFQLTVNIITPETWEEQDVDTTTALNFSGVLRESLLEYDTYFNTEYT
jgi:hypothetical protein